MDKKSTLNREPEPFYKKSHKAWYVQLGNTQYRLCDAASKTEKVPPEGQLEWHRVMARPDDDRMVAAVEQGPTVVGLVDAFLASLKKQVDSKKRAQRTLDWYNDHLKTFRRFIGDELPVDEFKKAHLDEWLEADYAKAGENYINGAIRVVSRVFNWGTSFAPPHVTGTVALLQQFADTHDLGTDPHWNSNSHRHEVMKAVLMNSADKIKDDGTFAPQGSLLGMEKTIHKKPQPGLPNPTWFDSTAYNDGVFDQGGFTPLDDEMGTGQLNANRAYTQFEPGEWDNDSEDVPLIGWDWGTTTGAGDINRYTFDEPLLGGSFVSITLAWDRQVTFAVDGDTQNRFDVDDSFADYEQEPFEPQADSVINNMVLWLIEPNGETTAQAIATSDFNEGTVQHIFFQVPTDGIYKFFVEQADAEAVGSQDYAVAWWTAGVPTEPTLEGDFDGSGTIDGADLAQWQGDFGINDDSDANDDGVTDGADFLIWQSNFGMTSATPASVPEPSTLMLSVLGLAAVYRLRVSRVACE